MTSAPNIQAAGASVELTINDARLREGVEKAKAEIVSLTKAISAAQSQMRAASKAGNVEEAAGHKAVVSALRARQSEVQRTMNVLMSGGGSGEPGLAYGLVKAGRFGRGAGHFAAMFGGEMGTHIGGGLAGLGHMAEYGREVFHTLGLSGSVAALGAVAALGIGIAKLTEWARESAAEMVELNAKSRSYAADVRSMRETGDRSGFLRKRLEEAEEDLSTANATAQAPGLKDYMVGEAAAMARVDSARNNVQKLRVLLEQAEKQGQIGLTTSEGGLGSEGAQYLSGYSIPDLLAQIAENTRATAENLHSN